VADVVGYLDGGEVNGQEIELSSESALYSRSGVNGPCGR